MINRAELENKSINLIQPVISVLNFGLDGGATLGSGSPHRKFASRLAQAVVWGSNAGRMKVPVVTDVWLGLWLRQ